VRSWPGHRQCAGETVRFDESGDETQHGRLAATATAQHGQQFAALDVQRQVVEHGTRAEAHGQMLDLHAAGRARLRCIQRLR